MPYEVLEPESKGYDVLEPEKGYEIIEPEAPPVHTVEQSISDLPASVPTTFPRSDEELRTSQADPNAELPTGIPFTEMLPNFGPRELLKSMRAFPPGIGFPGYPEPTESELQAADKSKVMQAVAGATSGTGELIAGVAQYMTSPQGIAELGIAATPLAPVVAAKWAKDMVEGGMISAGEAYDAFKRGDMEAFGKHVAIGLGMLGGAGGLIKHQTAKALSGAEALAETFVPRGAGIASPELKVLAPLTANAVEEVPDELHGKPLTTETKFESTPETKAPATVSEVAAPAEATAEVKAPVAADVGDAVAPVVFDSMFGPMPMFRATSEFVIPGLEGPAQSVGSKVSLAALEKAGLKVPESELAKASPVNAQAKETAGVPPTPEKVSGEQTPDAPLVGMGGAVPSEFSEPGSYVSNMFAAIDRDRAEMGKEPMPETTARSWDTDNQKALAQMNRDPNWIPNLLTDVKSNPRPLLSWENAGVVWHRAKLRAEYNNALKRIAQAFDDGRMDDLSQAKADAQTYENAILDLDATVGRGGTASEAGRSLVAQKMAAGDDFSLVEMRLQKRKAVGGRPLTDAESGEIARLHKEYQQKLSELESHLKEREQKAAEAAVKEALDKAEKEMPRYHPRILKIAEQFATYMDKQADAALERIKARRSRMSAGVDPTELVDLSIVGAAKISRGFVELAKWSDAMIREVGDWIKPHLDEVFKASQERFDSDAATLDKKHGAATGARVRKVIKKEAGDSKTDLVTKITSKVEAGELESLSPLVNKLARSLMESGIRDREELIDAVHAVLKEIKPDITRRDAMDAISGYGQFKQLTKDEISVQLRDLKGQMQQLAKLEDMASGKAPLKTGIERRSPSDLERQLIQQVNEAKKKGGYDVTNPEKELASAQAARMTFLRNRIADIQVELNTKTPIVKDRTEVPTTPEIEKLREEYTTLKAERDELFKTSIQNAKKRMLKTYADLADRISKGDYSRRKRVPVDISTDAEAMMIKGQLEKIRREFEKGLALSEMQNRSVGQKVVSGAKEVINLPRAIWSSFDLSAVGRQGGFIGAAHPLRAASSVVPMLKALASEKQAFATEQQILNRPNAPLYAKSKLYLASLDEFKLNKMEEIIMSRFANLIPGVRASNRAFMTYLNKLRADSFDAMLGSLKRWFEGEPTQAEMDAIANYINTATGRGPIGNAAGAAEALATVFWSPRLVASRFQLLAGQPLYHGGGRVRALIALEYARSLTGLAAIVALGSIIGASVETDPNSSDFLKLKIGNTRLDIFGGLIQNTVLLSRLKSGKMKLESGKEVPARSSELISKFLRSKLSPAIGTALDARDIALDQKPPPGHPQTFEEMAERSLVPLAWQDILEVMEEQGVPEGVAIEMLSLLGVGVQNYEEKKSK